jgi:hypothetical protein
MSTHVPNLLSSTVLSMAHELNVRTWVPTFLKKLMNLTNVRTSVPTFLTKPTNLYQFLVVTPPLGALTCQGGTHDSPPRPARGQPAWLACAAAWRGQPDVPCAARPAIALARPSVGAARHGLCGSPMLGQCPCTVIRGPRASLACPCAAQFPGVLRVAPVHLPCVSFVESH